ncbi:MAG TPA: hypothetical protein VGK74_22835 [Symbiobacteriaceae bacterium]|jgi:hypothetical protein
MQVFVPVIVALIAVIVVLNARRKRDRELLIARIAGRGGAVLRVARVKNGHPFSDSGRGWWVWQILWRDGAGEHTSWGLTTRDGIKEWRD